MKMKTMESQVKKQTRQGIDVAKMDSPQIGVASLHGFSRQSTSSSAENVCLFPWSSVRKGDCTGREM